MKINFIDSIRTALDHSLENDEKVLLFGLGVADVGSVFGTTLGLQEKYGAERVFDIPLSENAVTGMSLGLAIQGFKPIMVHQRADFSFTAAEQIINQIAKTKYMSNDLLDLTIVIRMIIGRGWGQGPTHAQVPHALYASIPGLKIVAPASPSDSYQLLRSAVNSTEPVLFLEHRWLHKTVEEFLPIYSASTLVNASVVRRGADLTLISFSYGVIEILKIADLLNHFGVFCEVINLRSISPLDEALIIESAKKTRKVVAWDIGHIDFGLIGQLSFIFNQKLFNTLVYPLLPFGLPNEPTPSSPILAAKHYPDIDNAIKTIIQHFKLAISPYEVLDLRKKIFPNKSIYRDQPDVGEVGPF